MRFRSISLNLLLSTPEGDGFQSPLGHRAGLLYLGGLQVVGHVLEPQQRTVGGSQQEALKGAGVLWPQAGVHQLGLTLHQSLLSLLLLLLQLMPSLLLGLKWGRRRKWERWDVVGGNDTASISSPTALFTLKFPGRFARYLAAKILVLSVTGISVLRSQDRFQGAEADVPGETCCYLQPGWSC